MKVLITGGAGFIGSALIRQLLTHEHVKVINLDKLTYAGNLEAVASVSDSPNYIFEHVDITDHEAVARVFATQKPDAVVHLAAESHVDRSIDGPGVCLQTNIMGTYVMLDAALSYHRKTGKLQRFHHVSTDEVFGNLNSNDLPFDERSPYKPSSPYAASKAASDHLVRAWGRTYGLPFVVSNCTNNYGPYQYPEKLIPMTILRALAGKSLPVYGDGLQVRDWLYVEDHARALLQILTEGRNGETYLVGGRAERSNLEVVQTIAQILQKHRPRTGGYESLIEFVPDRPGHDRRYALDPEKVVRELKWAPKESFETGLEKSVLWYLDNLDWLKRRKSGGVRLGLGEEKIK